MEHALESVLLEYSQDKVIVVDEDGRLRYANEAAERILGYDPDVLVGTNAFDLVHPADLEETREIFDSVIEAPEPTTETHRYRVRAADDSIVWLESRFSNVTDDAIGGYVISSRDVTEQIETERERKAAEDRLTEIAGTVGDVLWMFDDDWTELLFVNPAYEDVYGAPTETVMNDPSTFLKAIHPEDRDRVRAAMERMSDGESVEIEYRVNREREYDRWVWVQGEPILKHGDVVRIVGFARDVTDRRRRERQLAVMDNLLRHNLRNDMSVIVGNAEMISTEGDDTSAERAEIIRTQGRELVESAEKQREIIELLTTPAVPTALDLAETVAAGTELVAKRHPGVTVDADVPAGLAVEALGELRLAFAELVENAIEHVPNDDPTISVTAERTDDDVVVVVTDECPPIPEVEYRVLTGDWIMDDVYHTSGLGLWLVYWVVDLSDGEIEFSQCDSGGNTIQIQLPTAAPESVD
ncbi:PAS sensor protein [Salinarchaeum sp. Harcht-Bsk1]|uniref:PAS domain-containing protein n=1 Tax=Salinarchaeum sp. Harcht-Bsk1 TaxID=1333523 RepID=UPI0003423F77|nr:PAS domain S-box protein [Salinarchaeum sp. Harcht-Bsk1]AGN02835.1 PAS sensor protein [Salinarchaeum sp. Harcht-Bsk1]